MTAPNVFATATITSTNAVLAVTNSATAIVAAPGTGKVAMVKSLYITNVHATLSGTITVDVFQSSTQYRILNAVTVPINCSIVPIGTDAPIFLTETDTLRLTADANGKFEAVASYDILS